MLAFLRCTVYLKEHDLPITPCAPLSVIFHTPDLSAMALTVMVFSENVGTTFMTPFDLQLQLPGRTFNKAHLKVIDWIHVDN